MSEYRTCFHVSFLSWEANSSSIACCQRGASCRLAASFGFFGSSTKSVVALTEAPHLYGGAVAVDLVDLVCRVVGGGCLLCAEERPRREGAAGGAGGGGGGGDGGAGGGSVSSASLLSSSSSSSDSSWFSSCSGSGSCGSGTTPS